MLALLELALARPEFRERIPNAHLVVGPGGEPWEVFAYINHMHKIGRKMWLTAEKTSENITNGTGIHEIECNTAYDFDLQEALFLPTPWELTRDTRFNITCVYDSTERHLLGVPRCPGRRLHLPHVFGRPHEQPADRQARRGGATGALPSGSRI